MEMVTFVKNLGRTLMILSGRFSLCHPSDTFHDKLFTFDQDDDADYGDARGTVWDWRRSCGLGAETFEGICIGIGHEHGS